MLTRRAREEAQRQQYEREHHMEQPFIIDLDDPRDQEDDHGNDNDNDQNHENENDDRHDENAIMDTVKPPVFHGYGTEDGRSWLQKFNNYVALHNKSPTHRSRSTLRCF